MAHQTGATTTLSMGREATYGTAAAGNMLQLALISADGGLTQTLSESEVLQGDRNPTEPVLDEKTVRWTYRLQVDVRSAGFLFSEIFGLPTTTPDTPSAGHHTHAWKIGNTLPTGVTFEHYFAKIATQLQYVGGKIDGFSFDMTPGGRLVMTITVYGQDELNLARIDAAPYLYSIVPLRQKSAVITENGATTTKLNSFSLSFTNTLEEIRTLANDGKVSSCLEGWAKSTGRISRIFEDLTAHAAAKAEAERSLKVKFPSVTNAVHYLEFEMQEHRLGVASPPINGPGGMSIAQDIIAFKDNGAGGSSMIVTAVNDVPSYASIPA